MGKTDLLSAIANTSSEVRLSLVADIAIQFGEAHDFSVVDQIDSSFWEAAAASSAEAKTWVADRFITDAELSAAATQVGKCIKDETGFDTVEVAYDNGTLSVDVADESGGGLGVAEADRFCFSKHFDALSNIRSQILAPSEVEMRAITSQIDECRAGGETIKACNDQVSRAYRSSVDRQWAAQ